MLSTTPPFMMDSRRRFPPIAGTGHRRGLARPLLRAIAAALTISSCSSQPPPNHEGPKPFVRVHLAQAGNYEFSREDSLFYRDHPLVSPPTVIFISSPRDDSVSVDLYDTNGNLVVPLYSGSLSAGTYQLNFKQSNLPSGLYRVRYHFSDTTYSRGIIIMRAEN